MRTILVVVTARASYSRFKTALLLLNRSPRIRLHVVLAASAAINRYGDVARQMEQDGLTVSAQIPILCPGDSGCAMAKTAGQLIQALAPVFQELAPNAVVTIADRYETIATAIAASYQNIPLIHIQGGEVTGNIDEKVRHAITKLADLHIVSTQRAKNYLVRMGEMQEHIIVTGCPSCDLAQQILGQASLRREILERYTSDPEVLSIRENGYYVVLMHGVTDETASTQSHTRAVLEAAARTGMPIVWIAPNVDAGAGQIHRLRDEIRTKNIHLIHAMDNMDFLELLYFSRGIIGNSSVGIRECSFLGVPAVNVGTRQFGRERGRNVIDVGYDTEDIYQAICHMYERKGLRDTLYGDGQAAIAIAHAIENSDLTSKKALSYIFEP